ncbi:nucleotidyltransferase family protein [Streptomyces sp. NPDC051597]|uniref:nucleotidyltransferase family protein n=1 Tax=Streptomyces sp. NPDC051597 TaxID=3155049 RepID=UPI003440677E
MSTTVRADPIDLPLLYRLFDLSPDEDLRVLVRRARATREALVQLVFSVAERAGHRLGTGSADELRRARARAEGYRRLHTAIRAAHPVHVLKGPAISQHYPEGVLRPTGDLDLVVADERELWAVVRVVLDHQSVENLDYSVVDGERRHMMATLSWAPLDPLLDRDAKVDVGTAAYFGDGALLPVRSRPPADEVLTGLLAIAEERFQRAFHAVDALDVIVLSRVGPESVAAAEATVREFRLAPEVTELLAHAGRCAPLGPFEELRRRLEPAAEQERERRSAATAAPPARVRYGMELRRAHRPDWRRAVEHHAGGDTLMLTPVGDYLLVESELVAPDRYEAALAALPHLPEGPR